MNFEKAGADSGQAGATLDKLAAPGHLAFMAREKMGLWTGGGVAILLMGAALALWALYGPLVFVNALNSAWTCF